MVYQTAAAETEQLRTEVEELTNALERVLEALSDEGLTESERIARAAAIATVVLERQCVSARRPLPAFTGDSTSGDFHTVEIPGLRFS